MGFCLINSLIFRRASMRAKNDRFCLNESRGTDLFLVAHKRLDITGTVDNAHDLYPFGDFRVKDEVAPDRQVTKLRRHVGSFPAQARLLGQKKEPVLDLVKHTVRGTDVVMGDVDPDSSRCERANARHGRSRRVLPALKSCPPNASASIPRHFPPYPKRQRDSPLEGTYRLGKCSRVRLPSPHQICLPTDIDRW
jgi:hypothetical protein